MFLFDLVFFHSFCPSSPAFFSLLSGCGSLVPPKAKAFPTFTCLPLTYFGTGNLSSFRWCPFSPFLRCRRRHSTFYFRFKLCTRRGLKTQAVICLDKVSNNNTIRSLLQTKQWCRPYVALSPSPRYTQYTYPNTLRTNQTERLGTKRNCAEMEKRLNKIYIQMWVFGRIRMNPLTWCGRRRHPPTNTLLFCNKEKLSISDRQRIFACFSSYSILLSFIVVAVHFGDWSVRPPRVSSDFSAFYELNVSFALSIACCLLMPHRGQVPSISAMKIIFYFFLSLVFILLSVRLWAIDDRK